MIFFHYKWMPFPVLSNYMQVTGIPPVPYLLSTNCSVVTIMTACLTAWIDMVLMKKNTWAKQSFGLLPCQLKQLWSTACQERVKKGKLALQREKVKTDQNLCFYKYSDPSECERIGCKRVQRISLEIRFRKKHKTSK